jgi:ankyrin repeat protein
MEEDKIVNDTPKKSKKKVTFSLPGERIKNSDNNRGEVLSDKRDQEIGEKLNKTSEAGMEEGKIVSDTPKKSKKKVTFSLPGERIKNSDNNRGEVLSDKRGQEIGEKLNKSSEAGDDINGKNAEGKSQLHLALQNKDKGEVLRLLKEEGIKVTEVDNAGDTALHYAAMYGDPEIIQMLLTKGADVNSKNSMQNTPLHYALMVYRQEEVPLLLLKQKEIKVDNVNRQGMTELHYAAQYCDQKVIAELVKLGADVNKKRVNTKIEMKVLDIALLAKNKKATLYLLDKISEEDLSRATLDYIAEYADVEIVAKLQNRFKDIETKLDNYGEALLHKALKHRNYDTASFLFDKGRRNIPTKSYSIFDYVFMYGNEAIIQKALEQGAEINLRSINLALQFNSSEVVLYLLQEKKIKITDDIDKDGNSIAMCACMYGSEAIVQEVLAQGANINAKNKSKQTLLHQALQSLIIL